MRTYKNVWGTGYEYILNGTQIMVEREYEPQTNRTIAERRYFYDANGIISSAKVYYYGYNGNTCTEYEFFFRTNIQGDVLAVYNASGTCLMEITYDAWGNFTDTISTMSYPPSTEQLQAYAIPFRYRGYVYDQETGFYYLNSRYYDPSMHKFLNADSTSYLGMGGELQSFNLYVYCGNNPVMYVDPSGHVRMGEIFGSGITYENIFIDGSNYYFFFDIAYGRGKTWNIDKPINFELTIPENAWKIWDYSFGVDFHTENNSGFQIFVGTDVGFGWYNENRGINISFDGSGRLKFAWLVNDFDNSENYSITQVEINTHNIFGTVMVAIFAPQFLPAIVGIASSL